MTALVPLVVASLLAGPVAGQEQPLGGNPDEIGFSVKCLYDHTAPDDPIVFPGLPGAAHSHDFYGARTVDAFSTYDSMRASETSCRHAADTAGYWQPSMYLDGNWVRPRTIWAYYFAPAGEDHADVQPFPADLRMIAGDPHATEPQPISVVYWGCSDDTHSPHETEPYDCSPYPNAEVLGHVQFPSCWDGVNTDSPDHKSHMAYPDRDTGCPLSHPVVVPKLVQATTWSIVDGTDATLSSGGPWTLHGDFWNAWDQDVLTDLVQECVNAGLFCDSVVHNRAPTIGGAQILPGTIYTGTLARAVANRVADLDGHDVTLHYQWKVNGQNRGLDRATLGSAAFTAGDELKVKITPVDEEGLAGEPVTSPPKIVEWAIQAAAPEVKPGKVFQIHGGGFGGGELIDVHLNSATGPIITASPIRADSAGEFGLTPVTMPSPTPGGNRTLVGVGRTSGFRGTGHIKVIPGGEMNPTKLAAGEKTTFSGDGFVPGETVSVAFSRGSAVTRTANANGAVTAEIASPALAFGTRVLTASAPSGKVELNFTVKSAFKMADKEGHFGDLLPVKITGFGANETIEATFDSDLIPTQTYTANAFGTVDSTLLLDTTFGTHTVTMRGVRTGESRTVAGVKVLPLMSLDPSSGPVGTSVKVTSLFGWVPGSTVRLLFGGTVIRSFTANGNGSVDGTFTVPNRNPNTYTVKLEDDVLGATASSTFRVTSSLNRGLR